MEIMKFRTMAKKFEPMKVLTVLGEPLLRLNPKVLSLRYENGEGVSEFFADGDTERDLIFRKRSESAPDAIFNGNAIEFPSVAYGANISLPLNSPITLLIDFETLAYGDSRVLSMGTPQVNNFAIAHSSSSVFVVSSRHISKTITSPSGLNQRVKMAVIIRENSSQIIINGNVYEGATYVGYLYAAGSILILNGASSASTPTNKHKIHGLEIYAGLNYSNEEIIEYMNSW